MDIAADAGLEAIAPQPPPRAGAGASDASGAPSFQDHLEAARPDQTRSRQGAAPKDDASKRESKAPGAKTAQADKPEPDTGATTDVAAAPAQTPQPVFLQLLAAAAVAPQPNPQQQPQHGSAADTPPATPQAANAAPAISSSAPAQKLSGGTRAQSKASDTKSTGEKAAKALSDAVPKEPSASATPAPTAADTIPSAGGGTLAATTTAPQGPAAPHDTPTASANEAAISGVAAAPASGVQRQPSRTQLSEPPPAASAKPAAPTPSPAGETPPTDAVQSAPKQLARDAETASQDVHAAAKGSDAAQPAPPSPANAPAPPSPAAQPAPAPVLHHADATPPAQASSMDAPATRVTALPAAQVSSEIVRRFNGTDTSFQLRLDPPDLGRVNVRLDVTHDHRVTALITADTPQALSDLARGSRDLQQALQSAGLDLADDGLRFDLSSNGQGQSFAQSNQSGAHAPAPGLRTAPDAPLVPDTAAARPLRIDSWRGSRVDLVA